MIAVQYRDQSNLHMVNEFSKIGKKNWTFFHFVEGEKFHLYMKYMRLIWFIFIPVTEPKIHYLSLSFHSVPPIKINK